jgi:capsular polysaccharide transport system permease protein
MSESVSLVQSARSQSRIIGALLMREILTRYGRHNIGFMWLFVEPMMFTSGVLILWTSLGLHKTRLPMIAFALSGYATVLVWRNAINRCGDAVEPNRALMHHRNVRVIDLFAARIVLEIAGASMSFLILGLSLTLTGLMTEPDDIFKMIVAWLLLAWFALDMALIIGAITALSESAARVWHVVSYLFLPMSGAFFMVEWLPEYAQRVVVWIPTVSCTELLREGLFGVGVRAHYSLPYLFVANTVLILPGLLLVKYIASRVEGE